MRRSGNLKRLLAFITVLALVLTLAAGLGTKTGFAYENGYNITHYKMLGFVVSAAIAGAAGVLFSHSISTLQAGSQYFGYNVSILILVYVVLGGIGNISGSVLAAAVLYLLPELLRALSSYRMLIYSIVLIAVMLFNWAPAARNWRAKVAASLKKTFGRKERA